MIKDITIGQYIPGDSYVHKLDPRIKIVLSIVFVVMLFLVNDFSGYIFIIPLIFFIMLISKLKFQYIYKALKPIFILLMITALLNIFMIKGQTIWFRFRFINIYKESLYTATFIMVRLVFLIVGTSILTFTTSSMELKDGIEKLLNPFRKIGIPAHELAMMMTIAIRFIPTLIDETDKIMKVQMARGADFETRNIVNRCKSFIPLLVPLFISSFKRVDELAIAMEARCYRGGEGRTRMKQLKITYREGIATLIVLIVLLLLIFCRWWVKV